MLSWSTLTWSKNQALVALPAGMGTQWAGMGRSLMQLELFRQSILRSDEILKGTGLKVSDIILNGDESMFDDAVCSFVGVSAVQVRRGAGDLY